MNQYAFNVFLEKHRESQIDEGILGTAAKTIMGGVKLAAGGAEKGLKQDFTKKLAAGSRTLQKYGVDRGVAGDLMRGKNVGSNIRTAVIQGAPAVGKQLYQKGKEFVMKGGFSSRFNDRFAGIHGGATYKSALGQLGGGAAKQAVDAANAEENRRKAEEQEAKDRERRRLAALINARRNNPPTSSPPTP